MPHFRINFILFELMVTFENTDMPHFELFEDTDMPQLKWFENTDMPHFRTENIFHYIELVELYEVCMNYI